MVDILLVEDEAGLRDLVAEALSEFGHRVSVAENGVVALRYLEKNRFDVVVSDVSMPEGVSGIELANKIKHNYPESTVILVSGHARAQLQELPDNVAFLPKPYRIHQLLELLPAS